MALNLEIPPDVEHRLKAEAARHGMDVSDYVLKLIERDLAAWEFDLDAFLALPREEQEQQLAAAAEDAAPLYAADLALPVSERELTAFTALDGDNFVDNE